MATRTPVRPGEALPDAPALTEAEILQLNADMMGVGDLNMGAKMGEMVELTEAELAILQAKGGMVEVSDVEGRFDEVHPEDISGGKYLFRIGQGDAQFSGKVTYKSGQNDKVTMWHRETGAAFPLAKAHIMYYLAKGCWSPRPVQLDDRRIATIPCPSVWKTCKKKFLTVVDAEAHMKKAHNHEYKAIEGKRVQDNQTRLDTLIASVAANAGDGGNVQNAALLAAILELTNVMKVALNPGETEATPQPAVPSVPASDESAA